MRTEAHRMWVLNHEAAALRKLIMLLPLFEGRERLERLLSRYEYQARAAQEEGPSLCQQ